MAGFLTATSQDIAAAVFTRLQELGHSLSPSHQAAVLADIIAVLNADAANVVADMAIDAPKYKPPGHGNKF